MQRTLSATDAIRRGYLLLCGKGDCRFLAPVRNRFGIFVLDALANKKVRTPGVFPELHDSEAALAQIADLLVLLYGVVVAQSLEDAVEMCG